MSSPGKKRERALGAYHTCCVVVVSNVLKALEEEQVAERLTHGVTRASDRAQYYLQMCPSTISKFKYRPDEFP
jgi:hypothetical protein